MRICSEGGDQRVIDGASHGNAALKCCAYIRNGQDNVLGYNGRAAFQLKRNLVLHRTACTIEMLELHSTVCVFQIHIGAYRSDRLNAQNVKRNICRNLYSRTVQIDVLVDGLGYRHRKVSVDRIGDSHQLIVSRFADVIDISGYAALTEGILPVKTESTAFALEIQIRERYRVGLCGCRSGN
ncbi:hypothetical protein D3C81_1329840 [compost metagenome]